MSATSKPKLYYFDIPGRAEATRLIFAVGGVEFEDVIVKREDWPALKAEMPFGQMPVLEVDGVKIAQSGALERYAAKLGGLYPSDPLEAAKQDSLCSFLGDISILLGPTFRIPDLEEKKKAQSDVVSSEAFQSRMAMLAKQLEGKTFIGGDSPSYADLVIFVGLSSLVSSFMPGIPSDLYDAFPTLKAFKSRVASYPAVLNYYAPVTEGIRMSFKP